MFCFDAFAETHIIAVDEHIRERHSWTLGYQPDQVISRYRTDVDPPLKLDIFFPKDHSVNDKRSCVIFFFGGGWMGGATAQFYGSSRYLASRGMVAISAEYRTHNRHKAIPKDCVEDGRQAIRYVREHSAELGIDPNKIVLSGGSAGGHIAAAVAMCEQIDAKPKSLISSVPNALVLFNPVYNNGPNGGYGHSRVKAYWQAISPHHNIQPGLPPTIVFFGSADNCVPIEQVHAFQIAMDIAKNDCSTHVYQGEKHGFFHISKGGRKLFEDILTKVDHFLVNQDLLTGEQQVKRWTTKAIAHLQKRKHQNK
tara:strand:- start:2604 stop:3533 length:930 start_codon:yes stop_codon:yes gene_type:complete